MICQHPGCPLPTLDGESRCPRHLMRRAPDRIASVVECHASDAGRMSAAGYHLIGQRYDPTLDRIVVQVWTRDESSELE